jgi:DNA-binding NtrC family response regulator
MDAPKDVLLGSSSTIVAIRSSIDQVAETEATVLLLGETGTGRKSLPDQSTLEAREPVHRSSLPIAVV